MKTSGTHSGTGKVKHLSRGLFSFVLSRFSKGRGKKAAGSELITGRKIAKLV
jgi:hypothetical protein